MRRSQRSNTLQRPRLLLTLSMVILTGTVDVAAPPEVVRVNIPAKMVTTWFPAGTPLQLLTAEEFKSLHEAARRGAERSALPSGPRLIKAHHHARWADGMLVGSSELVAESSDSGQTILEIEPWTPMLLPRRDGVNQVVAVSSGKSVLRVRSQVGVTGGSAVFSLNWKLRALPDTDARSFTLGLPGNQTSVLTLELPTGWVPLGPRGYRQGPLKASTEGFESWQFHGLPGRFTLRLHKPGDHGPANETLVWVNGPTEVRLDHASNETPPGKDALANWHTVWQVQGTEPGSLRFSARLDPGLELLDVTGPEVREFGVKQEGVGTLVNLTLNGASGRPTPVHFRAHARVPIEGTWRIPALAPVDAIWTGGTTTVVLDRLHVIRDCRERAGVRLPSASQMVEPTEEGPQTLVFESRSPDSVADLVFRQARLDRACEVQGQLFVRQHATPELECRLSGLNVQGVSTELQFLLPPTWTPDRVGLGTLDEQLAWQSSILPDGSTRLRVRLTGTEEGGDSRPLLITARANGSEGRGSLILPRLRPLDCEVSDERWNAFVDTTLALHPVQAKGLAWMSDPPSELAPEGRPQVAHLRPALSWRWNADNASGVVELEELNRGDRVEIRTRATVGPDGRQLEIQGEIVLLSGMESRPTLPIILSGHTSDLSNWSFQQANDGSTLTLKPLNNEGRARLAVGSSDFAGELSLSRRGQGGPQRILFHARLPWQKQGDIPVLSVPRQYLPRGTIIVKVPPRFYSQSEPTGLRRLDLPLAEQLAASWPTAPFDGAENSKVAADLGPRIAHAFTYMEPGVSLQLRTEELRKAGSSALIREAFLITMADRAGHSSHRLRMHVQSESARTVDLELPDDVSLLRLMVDGTSVTPSRDQSRIVIPLTATSTGPRSWTVELDFDRKGSALTAGMEFRPVVPKMNIPCLAFAWELITPPHWEANPSGFLLTACDPVRNESWPLGRLGISDFSRRREVRIDLGPGEETMRRLDQALSNVKSDELTFAEWFTRWDSPTVPLLIDRFALSAGGYGPRSLCLPVRVVTAGQPASVRTLQQYGLALVPLESALLITSAAEASRAESAEVWRTASDDAQLWGSDRADRFQAATRWCGEPTPRDTPASIAADSLRPPPGWTSWRFTGAGWPDTQAHIVLNDTRARWLPGWIVAATSLAALLRPGRRSARRTLLLPMAVVACSLLMELWLPDRFGTLTAGLFLGSVLGLLYRLGALHVSERTTPPSSQGVAILRLGRSSLARVSSIVLILLVGYRDHAIAMRELDPPVADPRIPVLFPYEGAYDPSSPPTKAVLRQSDYRKLQELATARPVAAELPLVLAGASHGVAWTEDNQVLLTSDLVLQATSPTPTIWKVPIARTREISATIDGEAAPLFIEPGGNRAEILIPGNGSHQIRLRRIASPVRTPEGLSLSFSVNPSPSAKLVIQEAMGGPSFRGVNAKGQVSTSSDHSITAELGPIEKVDLLWSLAESPEHPVAPTTMIAENVQLWDIEPAGDLLRAHLTYRGSRPLSQLRFQTDPGLLLKRVDIPGLVASNQSGSSDRPIWTMKLDPPLVQPTKIELELWRPLERKSAATGGNAAENHDRAALVSTNRRLPRLEPLDVDRGAGLLGIRRPGHWTGRQEVIPGTEPLTDEGFVKNWGSLPDDRLTLAGTTRFGSSDVPEFLTGPANPPLRIKPAIQLAIEAGRIDLQFDAELGDSDGSPSELTLEVPDELVILTVRSEGLTDWNRSSPGRVTLRYDEGLSRSRRQLRVSGYLPIKTAPLGAGERTHLVPTPWLTVAGMEISPGVLTVTSLPSVDLVRAEGLRHVSTASVAPQAKSSQNAEPMTRSTYRVVDSTRRGSLKWNPTPPRVSVHIESLLSLYPDAAEWTAVLEYDVIGGPLDSFAFKLPTAWALRAQVELDGGMRTRRSDELGPITFWRLIPERPAWGYRRVVLRSVIPLTPGQEIEHPEISPLGWGKVDTYLGLLNATDMPANIAGSHTWREVLPGDRFRDSDFWRIPSTKLRVFHVARDQWSLKVQLPPTPGDSASNAMDTVKVSTAEFNLAVLSDHSVMGRGTYDTQARSGQFLVLDPPPKSSLLWTTLDQNPVRAWQSSDGRWLLRMAEGGQHRVCFYWSGASVAPTGRTVVTTSPPTVALEPTIEFPRAGSSRVSTLVSVRAPAGLALRPSASDLVSVSVDRLGLERADRIARQINESMAQLDRRSGRDREHLISLVIAHEQAIRGVERSLRSTIRKGDRPHRERAERDLEVVQAARKAIIETLRSSSLDDEIDAALGYLGQSTESNRVSTLAITAPAEVDRIRETGQPTYLMGVTAGLDEEPSRISVVQLTEPAAEVSPDRARAILAFGVLVVLSLLVTARPNRKSTFFLVLSAVLGVMGFLGDTPIAITGMIAALAGWLSSRGRKKVATPTEPFDSRRVMLPG